MNPKFLLQIVLTVYRLYWREFCITFIIFVFAGFALGSVKWSIDYKKANPQSGPSYIAINHTELISPEVTSENSTAVQKLPAIEQELNVQSEKGYELSHVSTSLDGNVMVCTVVLKRKGKW